MNIEIYNEIKKRILFFDYAPGEMLNEKKIAESFGVSRTPVREVLLRLEWEKLVLIIPRGGIMVSKVDFQQLREVFQTRVPLEGLLGRVAASRINDDHINKLNEIKKECEGILISQSPKALLEVDMKFREVLHDAANNVSLREASDHLYFQTQRLWYLIFDKMDFTNLVKVEINYMKESIDSLTSGDLGQAEEMRKKAILSDLRHVREIFELSTKSMDSFYM